MRLILLAAAIGGVYYAHTQGIDLWTTAGWSRLLNAPTSSASSPPAAAPNAGVASSPSSPSILTGPPVDGCGCGGTCGGCGSAAPSGVMPVTSKGLAGDPL